MSWTQVEDEKRYLSLYGPGRSDDFKRKVVAQGWIARDRALLDGFREGLATAGDTWWKDHAKFVGYNAFGPSFMGRYSGWRRYSLDVAAWGDVDPKFPHIIDPNPYAWDGGSAPYYLENSNRDVQTMSVQVESMNWDFMKDEALRINPNFWFEMSTWDWAGANTDPAWSPERYAGDIQYGMWIDRPRVVREYRDWDQARSVFLPYFNPVMQSVDKVWANPVLESFWRNSELVVSDTMVHPYQADVPTDYTDTPPDPKTRRMFYLENSADTTPPRPGSLYDTHNVFALARLQGTGPDRRWLVYAHAPRGDLSGVTIRIPGTPFSGITVAVAQRGSFYTVDVSGKVQPVGN